MTEGVIYKISNTENDAVYIGASRNSIEKRKKDHLQKAYKNCENKFYDAISTFGEEAFVWEIIDTASSADELAHKEKLYIAYYDSKENGYNSDAGGGFKKTVYKYDLDSKELIESFECLDDAGASIGASRKQISRACLSVNQIFNGFYWSYDRNDVFEPSKDERKKMVCQYSLEGISIACFSSVAEASRATGVNRSCIAKVCRGVRNVAGGYKFSYK